jgi:hypothetical protein
MFPTLSGVRLEALERTRLAVPVAFAGVNLAALAVALLALLPDGAPSPALRPGEAEMAQRSAAMVEATWRAPVAIDRRDRLLLLTYGGEGGEGDAAAADPDKFATAVCDRIRTSPAATGSGRVLRDWHVLAMPAAGGAGSCRIGPYPGFPI